MYAPLTGAQPVASGLGEAVTLLKLPPGDALGEAETFIHLPVSGAPPLVPSDAPPPAPLNAPGARGEAEEMKRPMMIGGMLGLVTALLALWIVWARSTPQDETLGGAGAPALGEQAAKPPAAPKPPTAGEGAANDAVAEGEPPKGAIAAGVDCYPDDDGDGFGRKGARPERYAGSVCPKRTAPKEGDCGDTDSSVKPGAKELCDGVDNDCSGERDDSKQYRDDNSDGKKDCGQSGPDSKSRVAVAYSWDKGTKQDEYLRITVAPPAGWKCKNHLVFSGDVQGRSLKRTFSAPSQTLICGIGFEGARLPNSIPPCVEGMTIAAKADSVAVEASCCIQNSGSYQRFKGSGDLDDMESCEYLRTSEVIRVKPAAALNTPPMPPPSPTPDGVSPP